MTTRPLSGRVAVPRLAARADRYDGRHRAGRAPSRLRLLARRAPREQSAGAGSAILVTRFFVTSVLNYAFGVALAWFMVADDFATVSVLQNILLLAALVLSAGFPWVLARGEAAASRGRGDHDDYPAVFRGAVRGNLVLATLLGAGLLGLQVAGVGLIPSASPVLLLAVALMFPVTGLVTAYGAALQGLRRFAADGMVQTLEIAVKIVVALGLIWMLDLGATGVALGFLAGAAWAAWYARHALRDRLPGRGPSATYRTFRLAMPMWVSTSSFGLLATIDVIALGLSSQWDLPLKAIAAYQVAAIIGRAMFFVAEAFIDATFPFMAAEESLRASHRWFAGALRCIPLLVIPTQVALLVAPEPLITLMFPQGYADVAGLVRIIDVGTLGLILTAWFNKALFAQGRGGVGARIVPVGAALEIVALAVLVPLWGATGAAVAFAVGSWSAALPLMWSYSRFHRLPGVPASRVIRHATAVLATIPVLALTFVAPHLLGLALLALALVTHLLVARAVGVVGPQDVERVRSALDRVPVLRRFVRRGAPATSSQPPRERDGVSRS